MMSGWAVVGNLHDIPEAGARVVDTAGHRIALFRTIDNQVFALEDRCPHRGGPISQGIVHGNEVTCPLHNLVIDLGSGTAQGGGHTPVCTVSVRVDDGGEVLLDTDDIRSGLALNPCSN